MKVYKKIRIWMIIISLISLVSGGIIEYKKIGGDNHYQFLKILVWESLQVQYYH